MSVTIRVSASSDAISESSRSRPTKLVELERQIGGKRVKGPRGGKAGPQRGVSELEEPFGAPKVAQVVVTEIAERRTVGKRVTRQLLGREGTQDLTAVRGRTDRVRHG